MKHPEGIIRVLADACIWAAEMYTYAANSLGTLLDDTEQWRHAGFTAPVQRADGMGASITVGGLNGKWIAVAVVVSSLRAAALNTAADVENVLAGHAHETIGVYDSPIAARAAAVEWARKWRAASSVLPPCECGPVAVMESARA